MFRVQGLGLKVSVFGVCGGNGWERYIPCHSSEKVPDVDVGFSMRFQEVGSSYRTWGEEEVLEPTTPHLP